MSDKSQILFDFDNVEPRTYIVCAIIMIFTLGVISILLTPEDEQFYETVATNEEANSESEGTQKGESNGEKNKLEDDEKEEEEEDEKEEEDVAVVEEKKKSPVKTPTKTVAGRKKTPAAKKDVMMSPVSRSGRTIKKPVLFEPGSPNGFLAGY